MVSTLGLKWTPREDEFLFSVSLSDASHQAVTKRSILSEMSKLFDPMGWLAPFLVQAKLIMQDLWKLKLDWDTPLSSTEPAEAVLLQKWLTFRAQIAELSQIRIPRWYQVSINWHLHSFADASDKAYSAYLYLVVPGRSSTLMLSKS